MKTGIVFNIENNKAIILLNEGEFIKVKSKNEWHKGDVITIQEKTHFVNFLYASAACFIFLIVVAFGGFKLYYTETSLISIDINPSIELSVNYFNRVISVIPYNEDAEEILSTDDVKGMLYTRAIDSLLQNSMQPFLETNDFLDFAVYSKSNNNIISKELDFYIQSITEKYPQIQINCNSISETDFTAAHCNNMSLGKYLAFSELQELAPELDACDYMSCGIGEIRNQIYRHHRNRQGHHMKADESENDVSATNSAQNNSGNYNYRGGK